MIKAFRILFGVLFLPIAFSSVSFEDMFPFGIDNGDSRLPTVLDDFATVTFATGNFSFFNATYDKSFVSSNGLISFISGVKQFTPTCGPLGLPIIAPFWADTDPTIGGETFYRETKNSSLLLKASQEIQRAYPEIINLRLNWMFITTWSEMAFYGSNRGGCNGGAMRNTFQAILTTDGRHYFTTFYYNKIDWTTGRDSGGNCTGHGGSPAKAGFDLGNGETFFSISGTCNAEIGNIPDTSNINDPGKWIFRVDETTTTTVEETTPYDWTTIEWTEPTTMPEETVPAVTTPEVTTPEETTLEVTTPEETTPEETTPEETTPEVTTPEETTPEVTTPEETTPEVTTPEETTPEVTTPEVTTPEETTPEETTPEVTTPEETTPEETTPEATTPEATTTDPPNECDIEYPPEGPWDYVCPAQSGNFQDICDCRFYYACDNWEVSGHIQCPEGLLFNPVIDNCDYPWNVDCGDNKRNIHQ